MAENLSPKSRELIEQVDRYGAHNYLPLPVVLRRGRGAKVWDVDGREYLDFLACYSALNFGHQHPRIVQALHRQLDKLALCSRAFYAEELCLLSEELARWCGLDSVLPMNSGSEAVETSLKVARKWGYQKKGVADGRAKILTFENNFHGRTISIVSFSSEPKYRQQFGPFTPGFTMVPFGDAGAAERAIDDDTVAILIEPIQAEAGILVPPAGYLRELRAIADRKNVLLIADEIQTGIGRTGRDFACQHEGIRPDMYVLGKSLGGGLLPISAVVARKDVMDVIGPGEHGSTFGGNPLACAVAREAIRVLADEKLSSRAERLGALMMEKLTARKLPRVKDIRGRGALVGIELDESAGGARRYCEQIAREGVLCKETHDVVIRLAPPLVIDEADLLRGVDTIVRVIETLR
jgi:ornithine--oxo-acid transaminase